MIRPIELQRDYPMKLTNEVMSVTTKVWEVLSASYAGDLGAVKNLAGECPELVYAQYNYTPPIHFAVREGHVHLVGFLLATGAHDPSYKTYPFQESLQVIAADRGYVDIVKMLDQYGADPAHVQYRGDNGEIFYNRSEAESEFEQTVDKENIKRTGEILQVYPEFALDPTFFWSEGILLFAAKKYNIEMMELLMGYGATVPSVLKWAQFYYFERTDSAVYLMEHGMNPDTMSWQRVTLLHDMAQKGFTDRAELLITHGANINAVDEEYLSTPLGIAARWGRSDMVKLLLNKGADPNISGATWSTPLAWAESKGFAGIKNMLRASGALN